MKKLISILLAIIMTFSMATVAFAESEAPETDTSTGGTTDGTTEETPEEEAGDFDWLLDLPFWTVKPASKIAKIALKFVKVYVKLAIVFGLIDKDDIIGQITDLINGATQDDATDEEVTETPEGDAATVAVFA